MSYMRGFILCAISLAILSLSACNGRSMTAPSGYGSRSHSSTDQPQRHGYGSRSHSTVGQLRQLFYGRQCGVPVTSKVAWITKEIIYSKLLRQVQSHLLRAADVDLPKVNFDKAGALFIFMGNKKTGGYAVKLKNYEVMSIKDETAIVNVDWIEPDPRTFQIQALSSPCLVLRIPKANFKSIKVIDQNNKLRRKLTVVNPS